jgi:adhesin transport system outer membrane protein
MTLFFKIAQRFLLTYCTLFFVCGVDSAQAMDLKAAIDLSLSQHPTIAAKKAELEAAQRGASGSLWQVAPSLSYQSSKNTFGQMQNVTRVQQPLFVGGRIVNGVREAHARKDGSYQDLLIAQHEMMIRVSNAYLDVIRLEERVKTANDSFKEHERLHQLIVRRNQTGLSSDNDVTLALMRLQQALSELEQMKSQEQSARALLSDLVGENVPMQQPLKKPLGQKLSLNSLEEAKRLALEISPLIASQTYKIDVAQAKSAIDRSSLLPQVYLRHDKFGGNAPTTENSLTYIAVEFQLGGGISSAYAWGASKSLERSAVGQMESAQKDVIQNLTKDWNQFQLTQSQIAITRRQLTSAKQVNESFLRQYSIGKKTWLEVLNAQKELAQTEYALADISTSFHISLIKIAIATGLMTVDDTDILNK